jgi:hypothetical protein
MTRCDASLVYPSDACAQRLEEARVICEAVASEAQDCADPFITLAVVRPARAHVDSTAYTCHSNACACVCADLPGSRQDRGGCTV